MRWILRATKLKTPTYYWRFERTEDLSEMVSGQELATVFSDLDKKFYCLDGFKSWTDAGFKLEWWPVFIRVPGRLIYADNSR